MKKNIIISFLILLFNSLTSCTAPNYHLEDGKWTWKYYHGGNLEYVYSEIDSINHETFTIIADQYAKDDKHVYISGALIPKANPSTFQIINDKYSKDKNYVFFSGEPILFANPETFKILKQPYSKDNENVFCGTIPLNLKSNEVNEFRVEKSSKSILWTSRETFIESHPEYKWLDTLKIDGVTYNDECIGKTKSKKFEGPIELKK